MYELKIEKPEIYETEIKNLFWENNISVDEYQLQRFAKFAKLITEKNEELNLISRKDIDKVAENHIFLSAYISGFLPEKISYFLDIGTGGGFPGIPLAIIRPMLRGVLVDSTSKKIDAVKYFINNLKLSNITTENLRVESEDFKQKYAGKFDLIVSRATCPLIILFRYSIPLIKEKAYLAAIKGGDIDAEFKTAVMKYRSYIKKSTVFELSYKPSNMRNQKGKKLILLELTK